MNKSEGNELPIGVDFCISGLGFQTGWDDMCETGTVEESKAWSCETAGENEFRLWRIILSPTQTSSHSSYTIGPKSDGKKHFLKLQALFSCRQASSNLPNTPYGGSYQQQAVERDWSTLRTESSEVWDPESTSFSSQRWREAGGTQAFFGAWSLETERNVNVLLICHLKKWTQSHPFH